MNIVPKISACLSIDNTNAIAYYDKPLNSHAPADLRAIDYAVMNRYLRQAAIKGGMVVVGGKTYQDMQNVKAFREMVLQNNIMLVVIRPEGITLGLGDGEQYLGQTSDTTETYNIIMKEAIRRDADAIFVLGGARVYDAFFQNYDEIIVGLYHTKLCKTDTEVRKLEDDLSSYIDIDKFEMITKARINSDDKNSEEITYTLHKIAL